MSEAVEGLPEFSNPPVREVVLGVQFAPLAQLGPFDLGPILKELSGLAGGEWGPLQVRQPTGQVVLKPQAWTQMPVFPQLRATCVRADRTRQLQFENGWLTMNWIRQSNGDPYARYETLRSEFDPLFDELTTLVAALPPAGSPPMAGEVHANFWEFSYVNALPAAGHWSRPADWHKWFPGLVGVLPHMPTPQDRGLLKAQTCAVRTVAEHEEFDGRVEVVLERQDERVLGEHGSKTGEKKADITVVRPSLSLRITTQGQVGQRVPTWQGGMDAGHRAGVQIFASLLSGAAKKEFGHADR